MMSKILHLAFKIFLILLLSISFSKAELINPNSSIKPAEVVKIQLTGLKYNDKEFQDSGIEQTWNFAHPNN